VLRKGVYKKLPDRNIADVGLAWLPNCWLGTVKFITMVTRFIHWERPVHFFANQSPKIPTIFISVMTPRSVVCRWQWVKGTDRLHIYGCGRKRQCVGVHLPEYTVS